MSNIVPDQKFDIRMWPIANLRPNPRNVRRHPKKQVQQLVDSIRAVGFCRVIVADEAGFILAGHASVQAARICGLTELPVLCTASLSDAQKRIFMLVDNRLAENAGWDRNQLALELAELPALLTPLGLDLTVTGFEAAEILQLETDLGAPRPDPSDVVPAVLKSDVTGRGDLWRMGPHRLLCGDARSAVDVDRLMNGRLARLTFTDPPYNVPIAGHVQGRGRTRHAEFAFASGEMDSSTFTRFLQDALANVARVSMDGAIVYVCMDWRHIDELSAAGKAVFSALLNLVVWNKTSPGQGSFYRSQHELIFVFKVGTAQAINAFGLGKHGRVRSNVWVYPGANSFHRGRADELAMHPTVKPVALVADAMKDCSMKGDLVLDLLGGSGTTLMAAEKVGRVAYLMEYEPSYVDVTIRRWQRLTKCEAILDGDGRTWDEIAAARRSTPQATDQIQPRAATASSQRRPRPVLNMPLEA